VTEGSSPHKKKRKKERKKERKVANVSYMFREPLRGKIEQKDREIKK